MPSPPKQLTLKHLDAMIADSRYRNSSHPEHAQWVDLVAKGFKTLFPGPVRRDETGHPLDSIANDGANENRRPARMSDTMFRRIKGETAPTTSEKTLSAARENSGVESTHTLTQSGMVHVRAYTRIQDGTQVEVSEYDRHNWHSGDAAQDDDRSGLRSEPPNSNTGVDPKEGSLPAGENNAGAQNVASDDHCYEQYMRESARCNRYPNPAQRAQCWSNAMVRYAACLRGR